MTIQHMLPNCPYSTQYGFCHRGKLTKSANKNPLEFCTWTTFSLITSVIFTAATRGPDLFRTKFLRYGVLPSNSQSGKMKFP